MTVASILSNVAGIPSGLYKEITKVVAELRVTV